MDNPGAVSLGDFSITSAGTYVSTPVTTLQGMRACALQARFAYGSGGGSCTAYVQTSLDQGQTWCDVATFAFNTAGGVQVAALADATLAPFAATDGTLASGSTVPLLGDSLRVKIMVSGVYALSTLLSVWAVAK